MSKHTPGPWKNDNGNVYGHSRCAIAIVTNAGAGDLAPEACANARLIAAAPDLLEAAQIALESANGATLLDGGSLLGEGIAEALRAAIARARGEE